MSVQKLGLTFERLIPEMAMFPPMLGLIHMSKSGCSYWSKMLKKNCNFQEQAYNIEEGNGKVYVFGSAVTKIIKSFSWQ